jgi:anti-anti-sigma regulatory factor
VRRALPLIIQYGLARLERNGRAFGVACRCHDGEVVVSLSGSATARNIAAAMSPFRQAIAMKRPLVIDMSLTEEIDSRFTGLLLMVRKQTAASGGTNLVNVPGRISRMLSLNGFGFLIRA